MSGDKSCVLSFDDVGFSFTKGSDNSSVLVLVVIVYDCSVGLVCGLLLVSGCIIGGAVLPYNSKFKL